MSLNTSKTMFNLGIDKIIDKLQTKNLGGPIRHVNYPALVCWTKVLHGCHDCEILWGNYT